MEEKEEREKQQKEIEDELQRKAEHEAAEKVKREKEERELAQKAIEKYTAEEKEKAEKAKEAKEAADKEYRERMTKTLLSNGYSPEDIEKILNKGDGKGEGVKPAHPKPAHPKPAHDKPGHHHTPHTPPGNTLSLSRPTYIKVHRKHLDTETLDIYHLPWEWDAHDASYIIIKQWIPEHDQDILFEHTRKLRERRMITDTQTVLKKERDQLLLVRRRDPRKKSPARAYILT